MLARKINAINRGLGVSKSDGIQSALDILIFVAKEAKKSLPKAGPREIATILDDLEVRIAVLKSSLRRRK